MGLAREWKRQLYGAWGAALLAPVAMIAALAVLAFGGGFGGLSALGQLVSGPGVPVATTLSGGGGTSRTASVLLPVVPAGAPTVIASVPVTSPAAAGTGGAGSSTRGSHGGGSGKGDGVRPVGHGTPPPVSTPPGKPGQTAAPVTTPAPPPISEPPTTALVNKVLAVGESVTKALPGPVGELGTSALQTIGQTLTKLLPPL